MVKKKKEVKFEQQLFKTADKLRKNMDAAQYKHIVLGLIFLKYISESFEQRREEIKKEVDKHYSDYEGDLDKMLEVELEDRDNYIAEHVFWVPEKARWSYLQHQAKQTDIGKILDDAMTLIEKENEALSNILPKDYARPNLDKKSLGELIDLISDIELQAESEDSKDLLGRVYEYFLGEFASKEGKKGGQFYTPKSIVKLMVEMIQPYKGRVYDPACGSGGMFVMSEKFIKKHQGRVDDIAIYGQESNRTTYKLCRMNLAIRGIGGSQVKWNNEGSFLKDAHKDLKADYILANPPFNQKDWGQKALQEDPRWKYGTPPKGNANYAWLQHMLYHLSPHGIMATVLANGSLSSKTGNENDIRENLLKADLVDCIVALPKQLFYNTGIPACIWFLSRKRTGNGDRKRTGEVLFIDASEMGYMVDRTHRAFSEVDIDKITKTYHEWRKKNNNYEDEKGYCKSANMEEIVKNKYVLTPGRYVGIPDPDALPEFKPDTFYTYVVKYANKDYYIGVSENLAEDWDKHEAGQYKKAFADSKPVYIIHHEIFKTKAEAEKRVKELNKAVIEDLFATEKNKSIGSVPVDEIMPRLTKKLKSQFAKEAEMNKEIKKQLGKIGFEI